MTTHSKSAPKLLIFMKSLQETYEITTERMSDQTHSLICKDTCILRTFFIEKFGVHSKQDLLYMYRGAHAHRDTLGRHRQVNRFT